MPSSRVSEILPAAAETGGVGTEGIFTDPFYGRASMDWTAPP